MKKNFKITFVVMILVFAIFIIGSKQIDNTKAKLVRENKETIIKNDNIRKAKEEKDYMDMEVDWVYDVRDPKLMLDNSDNLLKIRVKSKEKAKVDNEKSGIPFTEYNVEVLEIIKGEEVAKNIKIVLEGGVIKEKELVSNMDEATKEKTGADKATKEDLSKDVLIKGGAYYPLEKGEIYYITACKVDEKNNYYTLGASGFGVFKMDDDKLYNVLTGRELNLS